MTALPFLLALPALGAPKAPPPPVRLPVLGQALPAREVARDEAAARLAAARVPEAVRAEGLVLWRIMPHRPRLRDPQIRLTLSLPRDGVPFAPGFGAPERRAELSRRLAEAGPRIAALAAEALELPVEDVVLHERLMETCCGVGCQDCQLGKR